ncbi:cell wall / vacuolar inhibitor of fructosidase 2-like [Salvia miltiorrhiza]|uniref:cell wall / vacuolar inhibitor of fructosidase 2-like n=1 Tax=Salvia miltiorrhiza TaxID=226208 RepID=UPI0025ABC83A|nr:cell wall / vacuolar inhibitor of fructosidase 2-like [Salvia miltiorrhiza]
MAASHTISLMLTVAALCCLLPSAAAQKPDLAIAVCRSTRDFAFCRAAVYSDPRAPGADRYELIDIIFREAYRNASDTRGYIAGEIKSGANSLRKCLADYDKAVEILEGVLNDLNSESYYDLDSRSLDVQRRVSDCVKGLRGRSPLTQRNRNMLKFANMCYAVSKLF